MKAQRPDRAPLGLLATALVACVTLAPWLSKHAEAAKDALAEFDDIVEEHRRTHRAVLQYSAAERLGLFKQLRARLLKLDRRQLTARQRVVWRALRERLDRDLNARVKDEAPRTAEAKYARALSRHLGPNHPTPQQISEEGRREISRLHQKIESIMRSEGADGTSIATFMKQLADKSRFTSSQHLLDAVDAELNRSRVLAAELYRLPHSTLEIERTASCDRASYQRGEGMTGTLDLNLNALLNGEGSHSLPLIVNHETWGGHHLEAMWSQEHAANGAKGGHLASKLTTEAWACYAERLRLEQGGFTRTEQVALLREQLRRAARMVVDTGLSTRRMTREQASSYLQTNAFLTKEAAEAEVNRIHHDPGSTLLYHVGAKKLLGIRDKVKQRLGSDFDLKKFNDKLLSIGMMPLNELDRAMVEWGNRRGAQLRRFRKLRRGSRKR